MAMGKYNLEHDLPERSSYPLLVDHSYDHSGGFPPHIGEARPSNQYMQQ